MKKKKKFILYKTNISTNEVNYNLWNQWWISKWIMSNRKEKCNKTHSTNDLFANNNSTELKYKWPFHLWPIDSIVLQRIKCVKNRVQYENQGENVNISIISLCKCLKASDCVKIASPIHSIFISAKCLSMSSSLQLHHLKCEE